MPSYEKFTKDVGVVGLTELSLALRGLILLPIIAKMLGSSGYGIWAQVVVTLGLVEPLFQLGLTTALVRFLAAEKDRRRIQEGFFSVLCVMLSCSLIIALTLFFLADPISNAFFGGAATIIVKMTSVILPFSAVTTACSSFFLTFRQMRTYSTLTLAKNFAEIGLIAGLVSAGFGISGAVLSLLITAFVTSTVAITLIVSQIGVKLPNFRQLKSYLKFGLPLLPSGFFGWIIQASDRYVIGYFHGVTQVGIYSAVYILARFIGYYRLPLMRVLRPTLSKSYDEGRIAEVQTYLGYSLKYFLILAIPSMVGLSLLGKEILRVFTTSDFLSFSYLVILFLVLAGLVGGVAGIAGAQVLTMTKRTNIVAIATGIAALANLGLNLVFVPRFGILAAAGTTLFAYVLMTGIVFYSSLRQLTFPVDWMFILKSLAASAMMAAVVLLISPVAMWEVVLVIGLGAIVYGVALFLLGGFSKTEIRFLSGFIRRKPAT